jgi:hypothetical protein
MNPMAARTVAKNWPACMRRCVTYEPQRGQRPLKVWVFAATTLCPEVREI